LSEREPSADGTTAEPDRRGAVVGAIVPSRSESAAAVDCAHGLALSRADCAFLVHVLSQWLGEGFSSLEDKLAHAEELRFRIGVAGNVGHERETERGVA
jgi:hypothetical protein